MSLTNSVQKRTKLTFMPQPSFMKSSAEFWIQIGVSMTMRQLDTKLAGEQLCARVAEWLPIDLLFIGDTPLFTAHYTEVQK